MHRDRDAGLRALPREPRREHPAALGGRRVEVLEQRLDRGLRDVAHLHRESLSRLADAGARLDRLCELNVLVQARRLCRSTVVQQAWERGQRLVVHAWVYRLTDGLLRDLGFGATSVATAEAQYARAVASGVAEEGESGSRR